MRTILFLVFYLSLICLRYNRKHMAQIREGEEWWKRGKRKGNKEWK